MVGRERQGERGILVWTVARKSARSGVPHPSARQPAGQADMPRLGKDLLPSGDFGTRLAERVAPAFSEADPIRGTAGSRCNLSCPWPARNWGLGPVDPGRRKVQKLALAAHGHIALGAAGDRSGEVFEEPALLVRRRFRRTAGFLSLDIFGGNEAEGVVRGRFGSDAVEFLRTGGLSPPALQCATMFRAIAKFGVKSMILNENVRF